MPQSLAALYVHFVFSTRERIPFLSDKQVRLQAFANIRAVSIQLDSPALEVGGIADHVDLLLRLNRNLSASECVKEIKRVSSMSTKRLSPTLRELSWQSGYGAFSVDADRIPIVREYIQGQEQHHKVETFQEEFLRLLGEHSLEWDQRYVWD